MCAFSERVRAKSSVTIFIAIDNVDADDDADDDEIDMNKFTNVLYMQIGVKRFLTKIEKFPSTQREIEREIGGDHFINKRGVLNQMI